MANEAHKIMLSPRAGYYEKEYKLTPASNIRPGMLLQFSGTSSEPTVHPHAAATVPVPKMVAVEAPWRMGSGIDDLYDEDGETVEVHYLLPGDQFYALLNPGEVVDSYADRLGSDSEGGLIIATTNAFLRPLELVNNVYGGNHVRIRVEVL